MAMMWQSLPWIASASGVRDEHLRLSLRAVLPPPVGNLLSAPGHDALSIADRRSSGSFFDMVVPVIVGSLTVFE